MIRSNLRAAPLKVTVVSSLPPQKAITPYTMHLLEALAQHGDARVDAVGFRSLYPRFAYPGGSPERIAAVDTIPVSARRTLTWWNPLGWLRTGASLQCDIVHAQWWSWFLAPAYIATLTVARLRRKRVVVTVHNARPHEGALWKRWLNVRVIGLAHHIIVHAERNRATLVEAGFERDRISVVPMGVHALPPSAPMSRGDARRSLGVPANARVALLFGNLRPYKGADTLLQAAAIARHDVPALHVVIAGERWSDCPDPAAQARDAAVDDIATIHQRFVNDAAVAAYFAAADVVVLPYTHFDAQSAAGALALSSGKAMIVSDTGGLPDLVRDPRAVFAPQDPRALATALTAVLTDHGLRAKLEADARAVRDELSWDAIAAATVDVYRRVLGWPAAAGTSFREAA